MKMPWSNLQGPAKLVAISVAVFFVAGGLCGLEAIGVLRFDGNSGLTGLAFLTGSLELAAMALACLGIVGGGIAWIIDRFSKRGSAHSNGPQTLFGSDRDDEDPPRS